VILGLTLVGFMLSGPLGVEPLAVAWAGAALMALTELLGRRASVSELLRSIRPLFLVALLALGAIAWLLGELGLTDLLAGLVPTGTGLGSLLLIALGAAVLSNLINNLPATLLLLPVISPAGEGPLLAMLIGVGIGPNLSYPGSIANLLWRRVTIEDGAAVPWREFTRIGLITVPVGIAVATTLLWVAL
jgi:arsenical pump membrane protein